MGLFRSTGDNSRANTISDKDWRDLQKRAAQANLDKTRTGRNAAADAKRGRDNYHQARRGNN